MSQLLPRLEAGLLDTSVLIDMEVLPPVRLPLQSAVSTITLAELAAGPHALDEPMLRAERQALLQEVEGAMVALPFDTKAARAYGLVYAQTLATNRKPRGARALDLLIAATALANELPLFTRNPGDFEHLTAIGLEVHAV